MNSILQEHLRHALAQIQELEGEGLNLAVQGECRLRLQMLEAAYRQLVQVCFECFEWEDPG